MRVSKFIQGKKMSVVFIQLSNMLIPSSYFFGGSVRYIWSYCNDCLFGDAYSFLNILKYLGLSNCLLLKHYAHLAHLDVKFY